MKNKFFSHLFTLCNLLAISLYTHAVEITPEFKIVKGNLNGKPAIQSCNILADHLGKMFGKRPEIIDQTNFPGKGQAIFITENKKLDQEEWSIRSDGKNVWISGGFPRGVHYGVAEFLEKFGGVRWFTPVNHKIPKVKSITVPDNQEFRRKPAFALLRNIVETTPGKLTNFFASMNKSNSNSAVGHWPSLYHSRGIGGAHTFHKLTAAIPENRKDLLPMTADGRRIRALDGVGPGQLCYANKEFRQLAKQEVAKWIRKEKEFIRKNNLDEKSWLRWIDISQNDNTSHCECAPCKALVKKYGTIAGAQLEFINDIAAAFPEYIFQTFAYHRTIAPPKNIKPRDNVMIQFAFLSDGETYYDTIRPLSHPVNAQLVKWFKEWDKIAKHKAIWCYHRLYAMTEAFAWPQACYWYIAEDMRFYQKLGAIKMFVETEYRGKGMVNPRAFHDLHVYLVLKMMDDPEQNAEKLIDEFFAYQYGPAEKEMKAYSAYLKKRLDAIPGTICMTPLQSRNCFDTEFFTTINTLLDRAEEKVKNDPERLENVRIERLPVDFAAAHLWKQVASKTGMDHKFLCERLEQNMHLAYKRYFFSNHPNSKEVKKALSRDLDNLRMLKNPIPIPPGMEKLDIIQISALMEDVRYIVDDPDATYGKAFKLGEFPTGSRFNHAAQPMEFGIYNRTRKKYEIKRIIQPADIHQDEKYHLYKIGITQPNGFEKQHFWGHRSWKMSLSKLYNPLWNSADADREYEIYISCKLTGPAYVKDSTKENAVYVDKLVAVKRGIRTHNKPAVPATLPVPDELKGKEIIQIPATQINPRLLTKDPEAVNGNAIKLGEFNSKSRYNHATQNMLFGIYDQAKKSNVIRFEITPDKIPANEKYQLYKIGTVSKTDTGKQTLWGHRSWAMRISDLYEKLPAGKYDLYISCKLTGAAYVKDSTKENAVFVDRIIAVKVK